MRLGKTIRFATKNLLTQKRRSFLTMLGIIIGMFAIILVTSVGAGAQSLIVDQIARRGTDQIAILAGASESDGPPAQALGIVITTLTPDDTEALLDKNNVSHIEKIMGVIAGNAVLEWRGFQRNVNFSGTHASYKDIEKVTPASGRFFTEEENKLRLNVMVLGSQIAKDIFGNQDPVGQFIKLKRLQFKVIGVLEPKAGSVFEGYDTSVIIPLSVAQKKLLGVKHISFMRAQISDEQYLRQTIEEVRQTLIERHDDEDFSIRNIKDALSIVTTITDALKFFLIAVAAVSLFVGGVGVMNIMLISVKEKTREIGVRKAFGATDNNILLQFLVETIVITAIGAIIGIILGIGCSYLIAQIVQSLGFTFAFTISPFSILIACVVALLIGLIFGLIPAKKAANLNPIDALRYE
ncbi:MAG: FtsX-like permease family protein [Candidatus Magasanikbacteria bacterium]|jgi:putative ABC transport system permease protein|nr:FtsX-like permease family protein [Candidatus Magasanikbacteria bacterium]MBT5820163.1 FtsX-like permease family protein [Candidatus Magasanikbacteria bacterium]MBT6294902.1 FtsX-like permease family protein [Candidatus Magasanikbacteria bacterium]